MIVWSFFLLKSKQCSPDLKFYVEQIVHYTMMIIFSYQAEKFFLQMTLFYKKKCYKTIILSFTFMMFSFIWKTEKNTALLTLHYWEDDIIYIDIP